MPELSISAANDISIDYFVSGKPESTKPINLWQRELLSIRLTIITKHEFSYIKPIKFNKKSFKIITQTGSSKNIDNKYFKKTILISIWPQSTGQQTLKLENIELILSARVIESISIPALRINVKPLPAYLPPGFPVGKINITTSHDNNSIIPYIFNIEQIFGLNLHVESFGLHPDFIPDYSQLLHSNDLTHLESTIKNVIVKDPVPYHTKQDIEIPVVANSSGFNQYPDLKVAYYDPGKSKIVSYFQPVPLLVSLNKYLQALLFIFLGLLAVYLIVMTRRFIIRIKQRRSLWRAIINSENGHELALSLQNLPFRRNFLSEPGDAFSTDLTDWALSWECNDLLSATSDLNQYNYAADTGYNFTKIKLNLVSILKKSDFCIYYWRVS